MFEFLEACVKARLNIFVSGGTGSGKTTMLNILSSFIPDDERIVTIEDAAELQLRQEHVITLESRPSNIEGKGAIPIRELVRNALRMRPDRIVVGECRSGEALDMLQAMNTGHDGSMSTGHANTPRDMLSRLETMVLMAGMDLPLRAIREQISSAVDLIVHQNRLKDGTRKITNITEVQGMEGDVIVMQDVFVFEQTDIVEGKIEGRLKPTGIRPHFVEKLRGRRASTCRRTSSAHRSKRRRPMQGMLPFLIAGLAALAVVVIAVGISMSAGGGSVSARLERYASRRGDEPDGEQRESAVVAGISRVIERQDLGDAAGDRPGARRPEDEAGRVRHPVGRHADRLRVRSRSSSASSSRGSRTPSRWSAPFILGLFAPRWYLKRRQAQAHQGVR